MILTPNHRNSLKRCDHTLPWMIHLLNASPRRCQTGQAVVTIGGALPVPWPQLGGDLLSHIIFLEDTLYLPTNGRILQLSADRSDNQKE